ncbi:MAG: sugar ABC transporter permease, partial [Actinobacteria bacterium]|nr:sugar ABC transporter permease [Actinomycetota bacterium]
MRKGTKINKYKSFNQNRLWILFVAPVILYLLLTQIYPLFNALQMSFFADKLGESVFVGLQNYIELFNTVKFWDIFRNTFVFTVASVSLHILVGLLMAGATN